MENIDKINIKGFGDEWSAYTQKELDLQESRHIFESYFKIFDWKKIPPNAKGFDMGCGSGRWAYWVSQKVEELHCIDASKEALDIAEKNLEGTPNCIFHHASFEDNPIEDNTMDFGYSLGVFHHVPDAYAGIKACARKLKPGAPFLAYIYYDLENKPLWFRKLWQFSEIIRGKISMLPFKYKLFITRLIALLAYYPLSRFALYMERIGFNVDNFPLSGYRHRSFYTMKTDALNRFGTKLVNRFKRSQVEQMFSSAGFEKIQFGIGKPRWLVIGYKK